MGLLVGVAVAAYDWTVLVGPKPLLEQFVRDHVKLLADATLVMLEASCCTR